MKDMDFNFYRREKRRAAVGGEAGTGCNFGANYAALHQNNALTHRPGVERSNRVMNRDARGYSPAGAGVAWSLKYQHSLPQAAFKRRHASCSAPSSTA